MQGSNNFLGVGDQDLQQFWDQVSKLKVEMGDQAVENIPRYDTAFKIKLFCIQRTEQYLPKSF